MNDPRELVDQLEQRLAQADDRAVDEFRDRHPDRVAALDALRAVLDECSAMSRGGDVGDGEFVAKIFRRVIARALDGTR